MCTVEAAFDCFEQSVAMGYADFWCGYWATHCSYHLTENERPIFYANNAILALPQQEGVTDDVIAGLYEHLGSAQLDLELYTEAAQNYRESLRYHFNQMISDNLKIAEENIKNSDSNNFFSKLFVKPQLKVMGLLFTDNNLQIFQYLGMQLKFNTVTAHL
ncbi:hypothetical protein [Sphingobacterium sp.]|uniref:hypothetical protein n=1 Tax=Sphingobacterium sp. TaxID=341027 RepID=UPI0028A76336|nr:hypothetical protein [Sphingobacterium sp.]